MPDLRARLIPRCGESVCIHREGHPISRQDMELASAEVIGSRCIRHAAVDTSCSKMDRHEHPLPILLEDMVISNDPRLILCRRRPVHGATAVASESWLVQADRCPTAVEGLIADVSVQIYVNLGPTGRHVEDTSLRRSPGPRTAWVVGPRTGRMDIRKETVDSHIVGIRLRPGMAKAILGVPAHELTNRMVDLESFWEGDAERLRERLARCSGPDERLTVVEQALVGRAAQGDGAADRPAVETLCGWLSGRPHQTVAAIAEEMGLSHRRAIRLMADHVGLRPVQFRRVQRFRRAVADIGFGSDPWTDVAYGAGYADQPHMIREFRRLAGMTPVEYLERRSPAGAGTVRLVMAD